MAHALLSPHSTLTSPSSSSSPSTHCFRNPLRPRHPPRRLPLHLQITPATATRSSSKRLQLSIARAMQSNNGSSSDPKDANTAVPKSETPSSAGALPSLVSGLALPDIPVWARWALGAALLLALPFYRRILRIEDAAEKAAESTAEVVEKVAEAAKKIAGDVADVLPDGSPIKQKILEIERVAEEVDKKAEQADAIIHKIDKITDQVEDVVENCEEKKKEKENEKEKSIQEVKESNETADQTTDGDTDENPSTDQPTPK